MERDPAVEVNLCPHFKAFLASIHQLAVNTKKVVVNKSALCEYNHLIKPFHVDPSKCETDGCSA